MATLYVQSFSICDSEAEVESLPLDVKTAFCYETRCWYDSEAGNWQQSQPGDVSGLATAAQGAKADTAVQPGAITSSGLTQLTSRLLGRTAASTGAIEQITVGSGLVLSAGALTVAQTAWASWTPTWTNLTVGDGTVVARYTQLPNKTVVGRISIVFGSTTAISGAVSFTLPVTSVSYGGAAAAQALGMVEFLDSGAAVYHGTLVWNSTTAARIRALDSSGSYLTAPDLSSTIPFTWATGDEITVEFFYEAA